MTTKPVNEQRFHRWRELLAERLDQAVAEIGSVAGVRGLVVGGSVGRDEPWPLSDIDILPVVTGGSDTEAEIDRRRSFLVDWWVASGRAQYLDVGWLRFTDHEAEEAIMSGAADAAAKMSDDRWLHGLDKSYGGYGAADPDGLAQAFATWVTRIRFDPVVVSARLEQWWAQVDDGRDRALNAMTADDRVEATLALREAAGALRLMLIEGWGERLSSLNREWTLFERMAKAHDADALAARIAVLAGAQPEDALERAKKAPLWLQERIELTLAARREVGEDVTEEENARDQLEAFPALLPRRCLQSWGEWMRVPEASLESKLNELEELVTVIGQQMRRAV